MIIDTHTHLDDKRFDKDLEEVIQRAREAGVKKMIIPAADPSTLKRALKIAEEFEGIYFAVGVHPYDIHKYFKKFLEHFITHPKCVAVGECGLDYYRLPEDKEKAREEKELQKEIFIEQIEIANRYKKPLIVHIREASRDSQEILEKYAKVPGVLHCFNADHQLLNLAKKDFYFGIGGVITFKNARKLVEVYPKIPQDRLIIETDSPYLTPHPYRGTRNEPSYCNLIAQKMAQLSNLSKEKIEEITTQNAQRLFRI
jgi:TatD DNase family protein